MTSRTSQSIHPQSESDARETYQPSCLAKNHIANAPAVEPYLIAIILQLACSNAQSNQRYDGSSSCQFLDKRDRQSKHHHGKAEEKGNGHDNKTSSIVPTTRRATTSRYNSYALRIWILEWIYEKQSSHNSTQALC